MPNAHSKTANHAQDHTSKTAQHAYMDTTYILIQMIILKNANHAKETARNANKMENVKNAKTVIMPMNMVTAKHASFHARHALEQTEKRAHHAQTVHMLILMANAKNANLHAQLAQVQQQTADHALKDTTTMEASVLHAQNTVDSAQAKMTASTALKDTSYSTEYANNVTAHARLARIPKITALHAMKRAT